jgi:hypothetical protein
VTHFDAFNGDADGICALHQLRLAEPKDSILVTGVKRDVALLRRVQAEPGDSVTALDISLDTNRAALLALLSRGAHVQYFDHHFAGDLPQDPNLFALIDPSPRVCTAILVDRHLQGRYRIWAIVAAFGDNLPDEARKLAEGLGLSDAQTRDLRALGETLAYNAYGDTESDLVIAPASLYRTLHPYADPFDFVRSEPVYRTIGNNREDDLARAAALAPSIELDHAAVYILPDERWSRRVQGVFANALAQRFPDRAHAILAPNTEGGYSVSVRAPRNRASGADALCRGFATGGGRVGAAGINHLPESELPRFVRELDQTYSRGA